MIWLLNVIAFELWIVIIILYYLLKIQLRVGRSQLITNQAISRWDNVGLPEERTGGRPS